MNDQTIYIIGAGAIGKALAVFLKLSQKDVILIRGSVYDQPAEKKTIRVELGDKTIVEASVEVSSLKNFNQLKGIVVLTNKSFGNSDLAHTLKDKINESPIVLLQNGLGIEQSFIEEGFNEIYRCVLFATSQSTPENEIRFLPVAASPIGVIKGTHSQLNKIVNELNNSHFPFTAVEEIQTLIWKKAISNSVFNSVCPLVDIDNGIFHRNENAMNIARRVIKECVGVASAAGVQLNEEDVLENFLKISKASDGQLISTLQDIKNKRRTEIDTFNFAISNIAKRLNMEASITETKLLGELTRLKSELNIS